ncbi:UNVERIFIED_CONTAM: hypothetical protein Sradi_0493400 [Sesamum radiatum]|uniref:RNase H type-1 domain-containing protein n=1 Tax=Sesamum radiatum TaxID=300843 RepID=A0AAW2W9A2_SESRA
MLVSQPGILSARCMLTLAIFIGWRMDNKNLERRFSGVRKAQLMLFKSKAPTAYKMEASKRGDGGIKLNTDVASKGNAECSGAGVLIRNSQGMLLLMFADFFE